MQHRNHSPSADFLTFVSHILFVKLFLLSNVKVLTRFFFSSIDMTNTNKYEEYRMWCSFNPMTRKQLLKTQIHISSRLPPKCLRPFSFFFQLSEVVVVVMWGGGQKNADATAERNEPTALRLPLSLRRPPARPFPRVHGGIISH